jgi:hypothetical protein
MVWSPDSVLGSVDRGAGKELGREGPHTINDSL